MPYINMHPSYEFYQGFKNGLLVNTLKGFHFQIDPDMCQLLQKSVGFLDNIILNELEQKALNYLEENHILIREEVLTPKNQAIKPPVKLHAIMR